MIEIKQITTEEYCFSLKAVDGGNLLNSITFSSEKKVKNTIAQLQSKKENNSVFERYTNHEGQFQFNLKDEKGEVIGHSELYSSEAGMENGIKNVKNRIASLKRGHL